MEKKFAKGHGLTVYNVDHLSKYRSPKRIDPRIRDSVSPNECRYFIQEFIEAQKRLTLAGNIVISVGLFGHSGDDEVWAEGTKEMLDDMHKRKIDMADEIYVINVGGYIGSSTKSEIEYAKKTGKTVKYLEEV